MPPTAAYSHAHGVAPAAIDGSQAPDLVAWEAGSLPGRFEEGVADASIAMVSDGEFSVGLIARALRSTPEAIRALLRRRSLGLKKHGVDGPDVVWLIPASSLLELRLRTGNVGRPRRKT